MLSRYERYIPYGDIHLFNTGNGHKAWLSFGCHFIPELSAHRFVLWAPNARKVALVGDFSGWNKYSIPMEKLSGGVWICFVPGLEEGMEYMYCITGADGVERLKADPFAKFSGTRDNKASFIWNGGSFEWSDGDYMRSAELENKLARPMSVYEVHAGSWKNFSDERPLYRSLADALAEYCRYMGYTHVELLPITEHPFDGSWGYQVTGFFAPSSRYGNPDDFKYLVDRLHAAGIGVIMDWVPAHFPKDSHGLSSFDGSPLFERKEKERAEHPQWGTLIFDYDSPQVQSFLISSARMFIEEYHVDALRVDAVSSMLYLNFGREYGNYMVPFDPDAIDKGALRFIRRLNRSIHSVWPGVLSIAEESSAYKGVTAPVEKDGLGFDLKWDMGYMHDTLDYMALSPQKRPEHHEKLTFSMMYAFDENYVLAYSHDEVVYGKGSMLSKMPGSYMEKLASLRLLYTLQYAHPGKKLCFMGSEFGQIGEWNHDQKLDWLQLNYPMHQMLREYCRSLNQIYSATPALYRVDDSWDGFRWLNVNERDKSAIAFLRLSPEDESYIVCAFNFSARRLDKFVIGLPAAGTLEEILNSDDRRFGGSGIFNKKAITSSKKNFTDFSHSAELDLPPLSAVMYRFISGKE